MLVPISDFATHADPIRKTKNYNENLFLRTVELGSPDALGAIQSQVEGVLAHNSDGGHGDLDTTAAIVRVHHHQIRCDFISTDDVPLGHLWPRRLWGWPSGT